LRTERGGECLAHPVEIPSCERSANPAAPVGEMLRRQRNHGNVEQVFGVKADPIGIAAITTTDRKVGSILIEDGAERDRPYRSSAGTVPSEQPSLVLRFVEGEDMGVVARLIVIGGREPIRLLSAFSVSNRGKPGPWPLITLVLKIDAIPEPCRIRLLADRQLQTS
jgi:hypothetical protein